MDYERLLAKIILLITEFRSAVFCRTEAVPVVSDGIQSSGDVVHGPVELFHCALHVGGDPGRAAGKKYDRQ